MTVHVLTISHRYGADVTVYGTADGAWAAVVAYVDHNWDDESGRVNWEGPTDRPDDETEMVRAYFDSVSDEYYAMTREVVR